VSLLPKGITDRMHDRTGGLLLFVGATLLAGITGG
jgi:hypothetical protein